MYSTKFNSEKHREEDKFLCPYTLEEKARDQVKWYLCRVRTFLLEVSMLLQ